MTNINLLFHFGKCGVLLVGSRWAAGLICLTDPPQVSGRPSPSFGASGEGTSLNFIQVAGKIQAQVVIPCCLSSENFIQLLEASNQIALPGKKGKENVRLKKGS